MKITRMLALFVILALVVSLGISAAGCKAQAIETTATAETTAAATTAAAAETSAAPETTSSETTFPAEPITIVINQWGNAEAPGLNDWWAETAKKYNELHPNVTVEPNEIPIENIQQEWIASVAAGDPPDIQLMGRQEGIDAATNGDIVPIQDYWSEEEMGHILPTARREFSWGGKMWLVPMYMDPWLMVYNKKVFQESGLDPEKPPTNWDEFMIMAEKIKAAGFVPFGIGFKDGYMVDWWLALAAIQWLDDPSDIHQASLGTQKFTDPKHAEWWSIVEEINKKGYFNDDSASLGMTEGNDLFYNGKTAMVMAVQPTIAAYVAELGEGVVGVMKTPAPSANGGKLAGTLPIPPMPVAIATNGGNPEIAADVMRFALSEERVNALYSISHGMQASDYLDPSKITNPLDQQIAKWFLEAPGFTYGYHYPPQVSAEGWAIGQLLISGEITAQEAAQQFDAAAQKWRDENPDSVKVFQGIADEWASQK